MRAATAVSPRWWALLALLGAGAASAQPSSWRGWAQLHLELPMTERLTTQVDLSGRVVFDGGATASGWDRLVATGNTTLRLLPWLGAGVGAGWVSRQGLTSPLAVVETRLFEQVLGTGAVGGLRLLARLRLEHRFFATAAPLHRVRLQGRAGWRTAAGVEPYGLVESFLHLHDAAPQARAGLEQQRFQLGAVVPLPHGLQLDVAFLERWMTGLNGPVEWQHVLQLTLWVNLPRPVSA